MAWLCSSRSEKSGEQIFNDTWRRYRDFFYDPEMQQVDWDEMRERYGALIPDARTRWDITNIQVQHAGGTECRDIPTRVEAIQKM